MTLDDNFIRRLHDTPGKFVIAVSGGGSLAISTLLTVPGASRTVLEATVPYDAAALSSWLGGPPDQACSANSARAMAMAAYQRAHRLNSKDPVFGIACSAALSTDRERRGADRCYVAVQSMSETLELSMALSRAGRNRASQESACAELLLHAMADILGISTDPPALLEDETLEAQRETGDDAWQSLLAGTIANTPHAIKDPRLVFPGAFNPMHDGHREMARVASELTGHQALLEISVFNVDKPPLDFIEIRRRMQTVDQSLAVTLTNAPTFAEKAGIFPGATFMVGADTMARIGLTRYYHDSQELRDLAIERIVGLGARFLVFGRSVDGQFRGFDDIEIPARLRGVSDGVAESSFRMDVSSSSLRGALPDLGT